VSHPVLQVQYSGMQECLHCAEDAAAVAASECDALVRLVQTLIDQEARVRSTQAHRAHELREALQQTHAALRRAADKDRGAQDEVREAKPRAQKAAGLCARRPFCRAVFFANVTWLGKPPAATVGGLPTFGRGNQPASRFMPQNQARTMTNMLAWCCAA
jgi:hypothetical protein